MSNSSTPTSFLRLLDEHQKTIDALRPHQSVMAAMKEQLDLLNSSHPHFREISAQIGAAQTHVPDTSVYIQALIAEQEKVLKANPALSDILAQEEAIHKLAKPEATSWELLANGKHPNSLKTIEGAGPLPSLPQSPNREPQKIIAATDLGRVIRDKRKAMGLTQQQFADITGVGRRFISELESGKPTLEFGRVLKVCQSVGIELTAAVR